MTKTASRKLIIDCDPGCDDALGIMLAVQKGSYGEIALTTTAGNVPVKRTTINAQKIASLACEGLTSPPQISVYQGCSTSFIGNAPNVMSVHGRDGMGDVPHRLYPLTDQNRLVPIVPNKSAVEFFRNIATEENQYDLVCTGPLTNLATALSLAPDPKALLEKFDKVIIMGGSFNMIGNITPTAEFNFFFDPIAVKVVLDIWKKFYPKSEKKIIMVPLDITERVQLHKKHFKVSTRSRRGIWMQAMLQKYFRFHSFSEKGLVKGCDQGTCGHPNSSGCAYECLDKKEEINLEFCYLHDPLAIYLAISDIPRNGWLEDACIRIHTSDDEMRGTVYRIERKVSYSSQDSYTSGIEVQFLSPNLVKPSDLGKFKIALLSACGWSPVKD